MTANGRASMSTPAPTQPVSLGHALLKASVYGYNARSLHFKIKCPWFPHPIQKGVLCLLYPAHGNVRRWQR